MDANAEAKAVRLSEFLIEDDEPKPPDPPKAGPAKKVKKVAGIDKPAPVKRKVGGDDVQVAAQVYDVKNMSPQEMQELALQALVNEVAAGSVSASKQLLDFTEDIYVASNSDLEGMTPPELMEELKVLQVELQHIINKETVGV